MAFDPRPFAYAPKPGTFLCRMGDIEDPGAKGFVFGKGAKRFDMFIVRKDDAVHGYVNSCPHLHMPLEFMPDRFLSKNKNAVVCATHGARFRIADGYCFAGPCVRDTLIPVPLEIRGDAIELGTY